jgi:predicted O-methyltransferase YrrM
MSDKNDRSQTRKYERYGIQIPPLVQAAVGLAEEMDFPLMPEGRPIGYQGPPSACIPQVGQLLQALAAAQPGGRLGELGTGTGVGTAWLASGMQPGTTLISVEIDGQRAAAVQELFQDNPNVVIKVGDWQEILTGEPPFDLLFMDVGVQRYLNREQWAEVLALVRIGGQIIFDDLAPIDLWPREWDDLVDLKREFAFHNSQVVSAEVRTTATQVALLVTRIQ